MSRSGAGEKQVSIRTIDTDASLQMHHSRNVLPESLASDTVDPPADCPSGPYRGARASE